MIFLLTLLLLPVHPGYGNDPFLLRPTDFFSHGFKMRETTLISWSEMLTVMFMSSEKEKPPLNIAAQTDVTHNKDELRQDNLTWRMWFNSFNGRTCGRINLGLTQTITWLFIYSSNQMLPDLYFGIICILNAPCAVASCFSAAGTPR